MMPLDGLTVLDVSTILAGPLCCRILGDFGADVIKVEHPTEGDPMRGHSLEKDGVALWWKEIARNKRAIGLDLRTPEGAAIFRQLAARADVVVENFRPGTLERWGLGSDVLRERNPGLVLLRLTGFGQTGPYASRPGFGTLAEAMSGFAHLTGDSQAPPTLPAFGLADTICGIAASSAVLMALRHREVQGGDGQDIDINILEPMMLAVGPSPMIYNQLGIIEERHGNRSTNNSPRNVYETRDGAWVAVSSSSTNIARRVMSVVGRSDVTEEPWFVTGRGRAEHADLLDGLVGDWIRARDRSEVLDAFTVAGAAIAPVYNAKDIVEDPHIRQTEMLTLVDDPDFGPMLMHNVLWKLSATPGNIRFTGRSEGADTDEILQEQLGYTADAVAEMRRKQIIR
jgi:crotonobetainyl-CoA:carnitine CoA-transferase CaiB-like acyl-CoA transferase